MAVDDEIINRNPVKSVWSDYGCEPEEKKALTRGQQKRLMEFLKTDSMYKCYYPMLTIMQVYNHIADSSRIENELARMDALSMKY